MIEPEKSKYGYIYTWKNLENTQICEPVLEN